MAFLFHRINTLAKPFCLADNPEGTACNSVSCYVMCEFVLWSSMAPKIVRPRVFSTSTIITQSEILNPYSRDPL